MKRVTMGQIERRIMKALYLGDLSAAQKAADRLYGWWVRAGLAHEGAESQVRALVGASNWAVSFDGTAQLMKWAAPPARPEWARARDRRVRLIEAMRTIR